MKKYDVIVVGAGNAGLLTAATVAAGGLSVLVLDRNSVPGGCATSFRRGRFEFEASLHELANIGYEDNPGSVRLLFDKLGIDVSWHIEENAFRTVVTGEDGYDVTMPMGVEEFCLEMERNVPGSYDSVRAVFELAKKGDAALAYMSQGRPDPAVLMSEHIDFLRLASHTATEVFDALGMPKKAQEILSTYWSYLGTPCDQIDALLYIVMLSRYICGGPALPDKRSHEISLAIEKSIKDHGGEIRYNSYVSKIIVEEGRAVGVEVGGEKIYADRIVSNVSPDLLYSRLIDAESVPEKAVKLTNARRVGCRFFTVYLGLDCTAEELGIKDYSTFIASTPDTREQYRQLDDPDESFVILNCLNCTIPDSSPEGTCTLFLTTMLSDEGWGEVKPHEYKRRKNKIAERMISECEKQLSLDIRSHIEEIVIATPATFARYLNTPGGTPYGYELSLWDSMIARIMSGGKERFIDRLYLVGAHGERGDGYSSTFANGHSVGKKILKEAQSDGKQ